MSESDIPAADEPNVSIDSEALDRLQERERRELEAESQPGRQAFEILDKALYPEETTSSGRTSKD